MTVLPMVLIVVGVLLLLALATGLWWQRRGVAAVPAGPRTVADLVSKRTAEGVFVAEAPAGPVLRAGSEPAVEPAPTASEPVAHEEPVRISTDDDQPAEPVDADEREDANEPVAAAPAAVVAESAVADGDVPIGAEAPWRRATHMYSAPGTDETEADGYRGPTPEPRRVPALALLRPVSLPPGPRDIAPAPDLQPGNSPAPAPAVSAVATPGPVVESRPHWSTPGRGVDRFELDPEPAAVGASAAAFPVADPDVMFDSPPDGELPDDELPVVPEDGLVAHELRASEPAADAPPTDERAVDEPASAGGSVAPVVGRAAETPPVAEPGPDPGPSRRDPARVAAEQSAADLALLRTFGSADIGSRPDLAPVVALEGRRRLGPEPARGAAQPVRFRTVGRGGTGLAGVAVALLDDRGHESSAGRSDAAGTGELRAPHAGRYVIVATAPDHQPGAAAVTVGDAPIDAEVLLVRSASLVGTVTGEDGPIDGARVTLVQDGDVVDSAESGMDGGYVVADLAAGEYALSVAAAGCEPHVTLVTVPDEAELVHDVELAPAGLPTG